MTTGKNGVYNSKLVSPPPPLLLLSFSLLQLTDVLYTCDIAIENGNENENENEYEKKDGCTASSLCSYRFFYFYYYCSDFCTYEEDNHLHDH
jgi:hypothetical protein